MDNLRLLPRAPTVLTCVLTIIVSLVAHFPAASEERAHIGPEGRAAVAELADAIDQQNSQTLHDILRRIRDLEAGSAAIPILIAGLESTDEDTGIRCLVSLIDTGIRDVHKVRAIEALAQFPSRATSAVPVLQKLLVAVHYDRLTGEAADLLHQIQDTQ